MRRHGVLPVRFTGQHFTIDKVLIAEAIHVAELHTDDLVLDIGAGSGFLTVHLARHCKQVVAVENDRLLLPGLRRRFAYLPHVRVVGVDIRKYLLPQCPFKVVSSIPYRITSDILKSLMYSRADYFLGGALIMQLEPAQKLVATATGNPYGVFYRTFFDLSLVREVAPQSFMPPPRVVSALLKITRRSHPEISVAMKTKYLNFLHLLLRQPDLPTQTALKKLFRKKQVREIARVYGICLHQPIKNLSTKQWVGCFKYMLANVPERFHPGQHPD